MKKAITIGAVLIIHAILALPMFAQPIKLGQVVPELSGTNPQGEKISLSDLRGKVVLIDFWASWCRPCINELPYLKSAYNKYYSTKFGNANGFEIFSVSIDRDGNSWKNFIVNNNIPWKFNIYGKSGWSSEYLTPYGVKTIPFNFLIDENGVLIADSLRKEALETKLNDLQKVLPSQVNEKPTALATIEEQRIKENKTKEEYEKNKSMKNAISSTTSVYDLKKVQCNTQELLLLRNNKFVELAITVYDCKEIIEFEPSMKPSLKSKILSLSKSFRDCEEVIGFAPDYKSEYEIKMAVLVSNLAEYERFISYYPNSTRKSTLFQKIVSSPSSFEDVMYAIRIDPSLKSRLESKAFELLPKYSTSDQCKEFISLYPNSTYKGMVEAQYQAALIAERTKPAQSANNSDDKAIEKNCKVKLENEETDVVVGTSGYFYIYRVRSGTNNRNFKLGRVYSVSSGGTESIDYYLYRYQPSNGAESFVDIFETNEKAFKKMIEICGCDTWVNE